MLAVGYASYQANGQTISGEVYVQCFALLRLIVNGSEKTILVN
jgi:hypothetical protein